MAVIYYGDNQWQPNYYPYDSDYTSPEITIYMTCPHCQGWINNCVGFIYCPYCGKDLSPMQDVKPEILERLDAILKEVEEIKKELSS